MQEVIHDQKQHKRLTAAQSPLYARRGDIYTMAEGAAGLDQRVLEKVPQGEVQKTPENHGDQTVRKHEEGLPTAQQPENIKKAWEQQKQNTENSELKAYADWFVKIGVTPDEFLQNKSKLFTKEFLENAEKKALFEKIIKEWKNVLNPDDFVQNKARVLDLASAGVRVKAFVEANKFNWPFKTPIKDVLKRRQLLSWFVSTLKNLFKYSFSDVVALNADEKRELGLDSIKTESDLQAEKVKGAKVGWELVNQHKKDQGQKVDYGELETQKYLIHEGKGPSIDELSMVESEEQEDHAAIVKRNAALSDEDRVLVAEQVISDSLPVDKAKTFILNEDEGKKLIKIHEIGRGNVGKDGGEAGVFNYKMTDLLAKRRALSEFFEEKGITDKKVQEKLSRRLMETGILGDPSPMPGDGMNPGQSPSGEPAGPSPDDVTGGPRSSEDARKAKGPTPEQARREQRAQHVEQVISKVFQEEHLETKDLHDVNVQKQLFDKLQERGVHLTPTQQLEVIESMTRNAEGDSTKVPPEDTDLARVKESIKKGVMREDDVDAMLEAATKANEEKGLPTGREKGNRKFSGTTFYDSEIRPRREMMKALPSGPEKDKIAAEIHNLERNLLEQNPQNIEDVAWQIGLSDPLKFGVDGEYPVLQEDGTVNKANFIRWVRDQMMYLHDDSPDDPINFFQGIGVLKSFRPLHMIEMLNNNGLYFRSTKERENPDDPNSRPRVMQELIDEIKREVWLFGSSRTFDIEYKNIMGSEDGMTKKLSELYYKNTMTKTVWGKSSLAHILQMDLEFTGKEAVPQGEKTAYEEKHDRRLGAAINTAYLTYYNIADPEMIARYLGKDSAFFNKDAIRKYRDAQAGIEEGDDAETVKRKRDAVLSDKNIDSIFSGGKSNDVLETIDQEAWHDQLNFFKLPEVNAKKMKMVRAMISDEVARRHELYLKDKDGNVVMDEHGKPKKDAVNADYADTFAFSMVRWTGAGARNDWEAAGYDAWTKLQRTRAYRLKQSRATSGGAFGDPYTVNQIKATGTNFMQGVQTEAKIIASDLGKNFYYSTDGYSREGKNKRPIEIMEEIFQAGNTPEGIAKAADQMVFPELTMRQYALNHVNRAMGLMQELVEGKELKVEKFTRVDPIKGVVFERDAFIANVQEKFIKPLRYAYSTWGQLDFTMPVRNWNISVNDKDAEFQTVSLAEAMFGKEMLDIPQFWKVDERGKPIPHVIDPARIQTKEGKTQLWKQIAKTRIAAELYSHVDLNSTDPRYDFAYYETIIQALERIGGGIEGDETSMQNTRIKLGGKDRFFTDDDIAWIREKGGVKRSKLVMFAILKAIWQGGLEGIGKSKDIIQKHALKLD